MSGTHSMICMLCPARVTCPWEEEIEPVALAAGWVEFPKTARRRSPANICGDCAREAYEAGAKEERTRVVEYLQSGSTVAQNEAARIAKGIHLPAERASA